MGGRKYDLKYDPDLSFQSAVVLEVVLAATHFPKRIVHWARLETNGLHLNIVNNLNHWVYIEKGLSKKSNKVLFIFGPV